MNPPMTPKLAYSSPDEATVAIPGIMVWYGRLPGANTLGWEESRLKFSPRFYIT